MSKNKLKIKLTPFEQNKKNIKDFHDNIKMYQSAVLMAEAVKALSFVSGSVEPEFEELENMLNSTIISFSEFIEEKGGEWN